jgi:hypothetical protein
MLSEYLPVLVLFVLVSVIGVVATQIPLATLPKREPEDSWMPS